MEHLMHVHRRIRPLNPADLHRYPYSMCSTLLRIRPLLRAGASLIVIFDGEPGRQAVGCGSLAGSTGGSTTALGTLGCSGAHSPTTQLPKSPKSTGEWACGSQTAMSASSALSSRYNSWPNQQKRTTSSHRCGRRGGHFSSTSQSSRYASAMVTNEVSMVSSMSL